jgi:hypothetical protein
LNFPEHAHHTFTNPPYLGKEINTIEALTGSVLSGLTDQELKPHLDHA